MLNLEELQDSLDKSLDDLTPEEAKKFLEDKRSQVLLEELTKDIEETLTEAKAHEKFLSHLKSLKEFIDEIQGI